VGYENDISNAILEFIFVKIQTPPESRNVKPKLGKKIAQRKVSGKIASQGGELGVEVAKDDWHWRKYHTTPWLWEMAVFLKHYLWEQLSKKKTTFDGKKHPRTHIESYIDSPICLILIVTASFCNFKNNCGHSCGEMKYTVINALSSSLVSAVF